MKKVLVYLVVLLTVGAVLMAFTPLPYLPLNYLLKTSDVLSGSITGSLNSGFRIQNLVIKVQPEGEIKVKEMIFSYSGLYDYYVRNRLVIREMRWDGFEMHLPKGTFTNGPIIRERIAAHSFLIPSFKNDALNLVQIDKMLFHDMDIYVGKSDIPGAVSLPFAAFPAAPATATIMKPGIPPVAASKTAATFKIGLFELLNGKFNSYNAKKPSVIAVARLKDFTVSKTKFGLGDFDLESNTMDLTVKKAEIGPGVEEGTFQINGTIKKEAHANMKKDVAIAGRFAWMKSFDLSLCDGKIRFVVGEKAPGSLFPTAEVRVADLDLQEYFTDTAPISKINYIFRMTDMMSREKPVLYFNIGQSRFGVTQGPKNLLDLMKGTGDPVELASAENSLTPGIVATLFLDSKTPGRILVQLQMTPPVSEGKYLLAKVWYEKNLPKLTNTQCEALRPQAVYFGLSPDDFKPVSQKIARRFPSKKKRRRS